VNKGLRTHSPINDIYKALEDEYAAHLSVNTSYLKVIVNVLQNPTL
jgi:hypothetical protein